MSDKWTEAPATVIDLAQEIIRFHHPDLAECRIGFLMRTEPSNSMGKRVYAKAEKVSEKHKLLLNLDFLIWIDEEIWRDLETYRQRALIDHELCHCQYDPVSGKVSMRGHDIEEFGEIVLRRGAWNAELMDFGQKLAEGEKDLFRSETNRTLRQLTMLPARGQVVAVDPRAAEQVETE